MGTASKAWWCGGGHREKHMGFCHIEGRGKSLRGGFDDLLNTCMECPGTPDGEAIVGPPDLWALCTLSPSSPPPPPTSDAPACTSKHITRKKKRCCCKRKGKLQRSATALKPLTTEVNNVDYMAQCPLSRGGRYYTACE